MTSFPNSGSRPSRRDLLTARLAPDRPHIASLLVQAWPNRIAALTPQLNALGGVEVHHSDPGGRIIVTIEAPDDRRLLAAIAEIEAADGVVTASLVYHQVEEHGDV